MGQQGPRTRVLIVDNLAAVREGLAALLTAEGDFEVVGEADSADEAVRQALESRPDLVLLEVELPSQEAEASLQRLQAAGLDVALVALGLNGDINIMPVQTLTAHIEQTQHGDRQPQGNVQDKGISSSNVGPYLPDIDQDLDAGLIKGSHIAGS